MTAYAGYPFSTAAAAGVGDGVYGARESGVKFTTPADAKIRVRGIGTRIAITGTPTGTFRFRLYAGTSIVASTEAIANWHTTNHLTGWFASTQVLDASTLYRVVLAKAAGDGDASGNRANLYEATVENDANSKALLPFGGWVKTYWDGSSWTDTDTSAPPMHLILDTADHFDASGSGTTIAGTTLLRGMVG